MTGDNLAFYFGIVKNVNQYFEWLVSLGYETLSVSSKDSSTFCPSSSSESCYVDINYLTLELIPRLKFGTATFQFWSGLGLNVKQPLNKKASAILDDQIQATSTLGLAIGMDYFIDQNLFLPLEFQQQYFLNSEAVKVQQFLMKIGLGRTF